MSRRAYLVTNYPWKRRPSTYDRYTPSHGYYGDASSVDASALLTQLAPVAASFATQMQDDSQRADVLKAKIKNLKMQRKRTPMLHGVLTKRINVLQAKYKAAKRRESLQFEEESSTRRWRSLGQTGVGVGVALGLSLVVLTIAGAVRVSRK